MGCTSCLSFTLQGYGVYIVFIIYTTVLCGEHRVYHLQFYATELWPYEVYIVFIIYTTGLWGEHNSGQRRSSEEELSAVPSGEATHHRLCPSLHL